MNALEIDGEDGRLAASPPARGDEPIPGKLYKRTPLQQLRPWDHPELLNTGRTDVTGLDKGGKGGESASSLVLLLFSALVTALVVSAVRRR